MNPNELPSVSQRLVEMANDASIDAIIILDGHKIISWNNSASMIYGISRDEAIDQEILNVLPLLHDDAESLKALENADKGFKSFLPANPAQMLRIHVETHIIPLKNDQQQIEGVLIIAHDVSHRIIAEQRLQYLNTELQRKLRQLKTNAKDMSAFTSVISNDIKLPIRKIYTGIEQLITNEASKLSNGARAFFRRSQSSINRMGLQLDSLLTIAELNLAEKSTTIIDVEEVLQGLLVQLNERISFANAVVTTGELCKIKTHRNQLELLLFHLIDNALKFNKEEVKKIHITCQETSLDDDSSALPLQGTFNKLTVSDNGIGFSPEDQEQIFQLFFTIHEKEYRGNGIGLAIVRKIMESNEGFVRAYGKPGDGSIFECFFPAW